MSYGNIYIHQLDNQDLAYVTWKKGVSKLKYTKYNIKETDMRVKTATFTSPDYIDLTTGQYAILIVSKYHENFAGLILEAEYDEDTKLYTYQCQDWSRQWISKFEWFGNNMKLYNFLRVLVSRGGLKMNPTAKELKKYKNILSGMKSISWYSQDLYPGNRYKGNPMQQKISIMARDKSWIEVIRALVFNSLGQFDVWFSDRGVLQIEPLSKVDWENTGLHLKGDFQSRKFKFSTTNAITAVRINGQDLTLGTGYGVSEFTKLRLDAFFGQQITSIANPNPKPKAVASNNKNTNTNSTTMKNPFNDKDKRIIVSADGGSGGFKDDIVGMLRNDGWDVNDLGVGPGTHSRSYDILDSKYAVNLTIYNGADPATIAEPITGWLAGAHEKHGVQLVQMFDTSDWTNPDGMKPYRYGDFSGYYCRKAWDDNYSSGFVDISNLGDWYSKYYPKVIHVCGPSPSEAFSQFKAGGYFKSKGLK